MQHLKMDDKNIPDTALVFRKAYFSDLKAMKEIRLAASKTSSSHYKQTDVKTMNKAGQHFILDFINPFRKSFVVICKNEIVWYTTINIFKWWLRHLFVDPKYFGRGIGTYIIEQVEVLFKNNKKKSIRLYARLNAVDFYKKLWFSDVKVYTWCNIFTEFKKITLRYMIKKI